MSTPKIQTKDLWKALVANNANQLTSHILNDSNNENGQFDAILKFMVTFYR